MASCRKCKNKFPFFTIRNERYPNPLGDGNLCKECYEPYGLVLGKYSACLPKIDTDPRAAAWVALCYLLAAQKVNLVRTITAAIVGSNETKNSWETCRQSAMDLTTKAMKMLAPDAEGRFFLKGLLDRAERITQSPVREITIQRYASVWGDSILDLECEAMMRSGVSIDELNQFVVLLPENQWLMDGHEQSSLNIL